MTVLASLLRDRVRIERPEQDTALDGAGSGAWVLVADKVPAKVTDLPLGRSEQEAGGATIASRISRILMRYREDVSSEMRFVMGGRVMQITAGPSEPPEYKRREAVVFLAEEYRPSGSRA